MNMNLSNMDRRMNTPLLGVVFILVLATAMLAIAPVHAANTIVKDISPSSGDLGDTVTVTLTVHSDIDQNVDITDDLKGTGLSYVTGTFVVDIVSQTPSDKKGKIEYTLAATASTDHIITFDVKVDTAYAWDDTEITNTVSANFLTSAVIVTASDTFTINQFDSLDKGIGVVQAHSTTAIVGTETGWTLVITIANPFGYIMEDAVITDRFGAEIEIDSVVASVGTVTEKTKGKSDKVFLTWEIGDLAISGTATLTLEISTDLNPAGHQEYTELGEEELNSGATLKFKDDDETQLSAFTGSVTVDVTEP